MISVTSGTSSPGGTNITLDVEERGLTIVVKAGAFRVAGVGYSLAEDQEFTVDPTEAGDVVGYLVLDAGVPKLLVDEIGAGDEATRIRSDTPYTPLHMIFNAEVKSGITSLADTSIRVRHIVEES